MQIINSIFHKIEDRAIHLVIDPSSPFPEIKDALMKFMAYVVQIEEQQKAALAQVQAKPAEDQKTEVPSQEI